MPNVIIPAQKTPLRCRLFGHKVPMYIRTPHYIAGIRRFGTDGIGRIHGEFQHKCERCNQLFTTGRFHLNHPKIVEALAEETKREEAMKDHTTTTVDVVTTKKRVIEMNRDELNLFLLEKLDLPGDTKVTFFDEGDGGGAELVHTEVETEIAEG